jgi:hypothetical protein
MCDPPGEARRVLSGHRCVRGATLWSGAQVLDPTSGVVRKSMGRFRSRC